MAEDRVNWGRPISHRGDYTRCPIGRWSIFKFRVTKGWHLDVSMSLAESYPRFDGIHCTIYATEEECEEAAKALAIEVALLD